jgi:hypothetical protein
MCERTMTKIYKVRGDDANGRNLAVPAIVDAKTGDRYEFMQIIKGYEKVTLPVGTLVYIPKVIATCETCGAQLIAPYDGKPYWCIACSDAEARKVTGG